MSLTCPGRWSWGYYIKCLYCTLQSILSFSSLQLFYELVFDVAYGEDCVYLVTENLKIF